MGKGEWTVGFAKCVLDGIMLDIRGTGGIIETDDHKIGRDSCCHDGGSMGVLSPKEASLTQLGLADSRRALGGDDL